MDNKKNYKLIYFSLLGLSIILVFIIGFFNRNHSLFQQKGYINLSSSRLGSRVITINDLFEHQESRSGAMYDVYKLEMDLSPYDKELAISLPPCNGNFQIIINGQNIYTQQTKDMPISYLQIINYHTDNPHLNIVLYSSKKGIEESPLTTPLYSSDFTIGSAEAINSSRRFGDIASMLILIICLISAVFHVTLFIMRDYSKIHLYFCLLAFSSAIIYLLHNFALLVAFVPVISFSIGYRIILLALNLRLQSYLLYAEQFIGATKKMIIKKIFIGINILFYIIPFVIPTGKLYMAEQTINIIFLIAVMLTIGNTIHFHVYEENLNSFLLSIAHLILFVGAFTDFEYVIHLTSLNSMVMYCIMIFILIETFVQSITFKHSARNVGKLADDLKSTVFELQNNKSTFISSHLKPNFLYETLDSIYNYCGNDDAKTDKLIQALAKYLRQSIDFSNENQKYSIKTEIDVCKAYATLAMEQHPEIKINFDIEEELPNVIVPQLCILALVDNSVTYAFDAVLQPRVKVTIYQDIDDNMIHISVIDNGNGMSLEDAKVALVIPNKHLSIGLYHINQQLLDMGGTGLNINTGHRKGTQISFAVGINEVEVQNEF